MDWVKQFCAKDCPDTCGFLAKTDNGKLITKQYDWNFLDNPFVCRKLKFFYDREVKNNTSYSFIGSKKTGIDDVLKNVSKLLKDAEKNKKKILYYRGSGNLGYGMYAWDLLLSQFSSVYFVDGSPCDETGIEAHIEDFGICTNPPIYNLEKCENILIFGKNAFVCSPHLYAYLKKLKRTKKLIYIDPVATQTSKLCHEYIQNKPGSDGVIANAILSYLGLEKPLFNDLRNLAGITEDQLKLLVDTIKPNKTGIIEGYGLQRYTNGKNSIKWLNRLALETNNLDLLYYSRSSKEGLKKPNISPKNKIFMADLAKYLKNDFFDVIFIVAANPVMSLPDNETWEKALDEAVVVVVDTNFTQTSNYADFFIKVGGMFSQSDIQGSYFFNKTLRKNPLIKDITDLDVTHEIAKRLGLAMKFSSKYTENEPVDERKKILEQIPLNLPTHETSRIRLLSLPHPSYLNSQNNPVETETIYISKNVAERFDFKDNDLVVVENNGKKEKFTLKVSAKIKGLTALVHKSRAKSVNHIFETKPTDTKRAIAFNDTFVKINKERNKF